MTPQRISLVLINYPGAMQSALSGWADMFQFANRLDKAGPDTDVRFETQLLQVSELSPGHGADLFRLPHSQQTAQPQQAQATTVILIPPALEGHYYQTPDAPLLHWLKRQHQHGVIIASSGAGSFIIAASGLLNQRRACTHWQLSQAFEQQFNEVELDTEPMIINHGDIITSAGMMSWPDLGLELVRQYSSEAHMRALAKTLLLDSGIRQQRFYQRFSPKLNHSDDAIAKAQQLMQQQFQQPLLIRQLAEQCHLTERTLLRRFSKATGLRPLQYLQALRIQKACDLLETSHTALEQIAHQVGYDDVSAFRKVFNKSMGLTPGEFKARFSRLLNEPENSVEHSEAKQMPAKKKATVGESQQNLTRENQTEAIR